MKIQTGKPVRGDEYFVRTALIDRAWRILEDGRHVLIVAPRRVGKTSLMYYLHDNPKPGYQFVYVITESDNNENDFYRKIVNKVMKTDLVRKSEKVKSFFKLHLPNIEKIGPDGVEFGVKDEHDYYELLKSILKSVSGEEKLIILLDEFPETLENIIETDGENAGKHFLQSNRELRQDQEISKNIQFIYTGSIGLESIVSRIKTISTINDLTRLQVPALSVDESKELIDLLSESVDFQMTDHSMDYILNKIEWLIPFYIQMIMEELRNLYLDNPFDTLTNKIIDQAFEKSLEQRNHFEHWQSRLQRSLQGTDYSFTKDLLNLTSENGKIDKNEIFNLAVKYGKEEEYKEFVASLVYDGYINNNDDQNTYRFNSPILMMWWRQNVAS